MYICWNGSARMLRWLGRRMEHMGTKLFKASPRADGETKASYEDGIETRDSCAVLNIVQCVKREGGW